MKASERLRERKPEGIVVSDAPYEGYADRVLITQAERDLIADVVEAAEVAEHFATGRDQEWPKLRAALTALREQLETQ